MLTYMTHPEHGVHVAYDENEVETCKKNGWSVQGSNPPDAEELEPAKPFRVEHTYEKFEMPDEPVVKRKPGRPRKVK